jgi:lysophospholipase L1-like esterase
VSDRRRPLWRAGTFGSAALLAAASLAGPLPAAFARTQPGPPAGRHPTPAPAASHRSPPAVQLSGVDTVPISGVDTVPITSGGSRQRCLAAVAHRPGPLLAVVGASFAAGVGAPVPAEAWSVDLAHDLHWRAVIAGVPGMGYTHVGVDHLGPAARVLPLMALGRLRPRLLVLQLGHDDWRAPPAQESIAVRSLLASLHRQLPHTRLAVITVFSRHGAARLPLVDTNRSILASVRAVAPSALIMDPLASRWRFDRHTPGRLHPSATGHRQIAALVLRSLHDHGLSPVTMPAAGTPPVCQMVATPWRHRPPVDGLHPATITRGPNFAFVPRARKYLPR